VDSAAKHSGGCHDEHLRRSGGLVTNLDLEQMCTGRRNRCAGQGNDGHRDACDGGPQHGGSSLRLVRWRYWDRHPRLPAPVVLTSMLKVLQPA
jgi:hypothetical protein